MKKVLIPLLIIIICFVACKKDKTLCLQSTVTFDYHIMNQFDSTFTQSKLCMEESKWETITLEGNFNPTTGDFIATDNKEGTTKATYYNSQRGDSVTRTTVTVSVPE